MGELEARVVGADRVLAVLAELAQHPDGIGLDELSGIMHSTKATTHRALQSLRRVGFAEQDAQRRYLLGSEFQRLAFSNHDARPDHRRIRGALDSLSLSFAETAQYGVLMGTSIVYRSKSDGAAGALKLTSIVGGQDPAHSTAIGKLLLSFALTTDDAAEEWVAAHPLSRRTPNTIVDKEAFVVELSKIRAQQFAVDDQENELGVNCLAVPAFLGTSAAPTGAVSVSTFATRTPLNMLVAEVGRIRAVVAESEIGQLGLSTAVA